MKNSRQFGSKGAYLMHQLQNLGYHNIKEAHSPSYITAVKDGKTHCFEIASGKSGWDIAEWLKTPEQIEWERMVAEADNYSLAFVHIKDGSEPQAVLFTPSSHAVRA